MCITCTCDKGIFKKSKNIQTFCIYECRVCTKEMSKSKECGA